VSIRNTNPKRTNFYGDTNLPARFYARFYDLWTVLDFAFVPEFLATTSLLEPAEVCRTELKPFLTIFGTSMRAMLGRKTGAPLVKVLNPFGFGDGPTC
jgi:hypothetical protein